jgi:DNA invertase Pin-like site-specific DNA recombinase
VLASIPSATVFGVDGRPVDVEVHVSTGLPAFNIVGLPDAPCRESRDRVRAALLSSELPWSLKRITVNLAPGGIRKGGAGLDLPIAIGLLVASGDLPAGAVEGLSFIGELGLDGSVRSTAGTVPMVEALQTPGIVVPFGCAREAAVVGRHQVRVASTLRELVSCLKGDTPWPDLPEPEPPLPPGRHLDLADVRGQQVGRTALEVCAAGGHHLLLSGPPGSGKTMLAARLPGLLPELTREDALMATRIHSAAGLALPPGGLVREPPFRAPHHGASFVSLIGGGSSWMRPGEVSMAHRDDKVCCMKPSATTAAIYVRISRDPDGLRAGVERQEADCRSLCDRHGWEVVAVHVDNDTSAYSGKPRPGYRRLLSDLKRRKVGAVVAWHNDRLHRSPAELEDFIAVVEDTEATVAMVEGGTYDLTSPEGRMSARILGATARYESEHKSARLRRLHLDLAEQGKPSGGARPFGYQITDPWGWEVDSTEAELVREAARRVLEVGDTLKGLVNDWNRRGIVTATGGAWNPVGMKRLLVAGRIAGLRTHKGQERPAKWPAIVDVTTLDELRAVLSDPSRRTAKSNARTYLLTSGLAVCGFEGCGGAMFARPRANGDRCYICAGVIPGHQARIGAEPLEAMVRDKVLEALTSPAVIAAQGHLAEAGEESRTLAADLRQVEERLQAAEDAHYVEGVLNRDGYERVRTKLERQQQALQGRIADLRGNRTLGRLPIGEVALRATWDAADLAWRREVIGLLIEQVVISPARRGLNRFDPTRVKIVPNAGVQQEAS